MALKYFLDQEFIEGFVKPIRWLPTIGRFNRPVWRLQLISIGIVCEDGRRYYAISTEFNPKDANDWVLENVLAKLPPVVLAAPRWDEGVKTQKAYNQIYLPNENYKSLKQIARDVFHFFNDNQTSSANLEYEVDHRLFIESMMSADTDTNMVINKWRKRHNAAEVLLLHKSAAQYSDYMYYAQPEIYTYYGDYDWTCFCSQLYGTMMQLPKGFPMYSRDLKQMIDDVVTDITLRYLRAVEDEKNSKLNREPDEMFRLNLKSLKNMRDYPKQVNEHHALADAEWNWELFKFILKYKPSI